MIGPHSRAFCSCCHRASLARCENAIHPFVIGRKGWLFADTVAGAQASATLYSLVETCKATGIEPYRYLLWIFKTLPLAITADDHAALTPWSGPAQTEPCGASLFERLQWNIGSIFCEDALQGVLDANPGGMLVDEKRDIEQP